MKKLFIAVTFLFVNHVTYAQNTWGELSNEQQRLLLPFQSDWNNLDMQTRSKLLNNSDKWLKMTPLEKKESQQKLNKFKQLPLAEQQQIRKKIERYKQMSKEDRMYLYRAQNKYKQLNPVQKRKIKRRFKQMPMEQRDKKIIQHMKRQQARKFVGEFDMENRQAIMQMFKSLPEFNRIKLRKHLRNLPPNQRHTFTLELLEMDSSNRIKAIEKIGSM